MSRYPKPSGASWRLARSAGVLLILNVTFSLVADQEQPWLDDPDAIARQVEFDNHLKDLAIEEMQRLAHHPEIPDTMYASTPSSVSNASTLVCLVPNHETDSRVVAASARLRHDRLVRNVDEARTGAPKDRYTLGSSIHRNNEWRNTHSNANSLDLSSISDVSSALPTHGLGHAGEASSSSGTPLHVPLVYAGSESQYQSLVRISNRSEFSGTIQVVAIDDIGQRKQPITLELDRFQTIQLSASELEQGSRTLGIDQGIGVGVGNWRLEITSGLAMDANSYVRTRDDLLVSMHDTVPMRDGRHHILTFFPLSDPKRVSTLRLINPNDTLAEVLVTSFDDQGNKNGSASLRLAPGASTFIGSEELEVENEIVRGALDPTDSIRQLWIDSDSPIQVMNLVESSSGHTTNISSVIEATRSEFTWIAIPSSLLENEMRRGFIRFVNLSEKSGFINLTAQDGGPTNYPNIQIPIDGNAAVHLRASDIEKGNPDLGIQQGIGFGAEELRVNVDSDVDFVFTSLSETDDGFIVPTHDFSLDEVPAYSIEIFGGQTSSQLGNTLKLFNPTQDVVRVEVVKINNRRGIHSEVFRLELMPGQLHSLTLEDLASRASGYDVILSGELEAWRLQLSSDREILLQNVVTGLDGRVANLSPTPISQTQSSNSTNTSDADNATDYFNNNIYSQILQARCMNCHVEGGRSGHTRLVFTITDNTDEDKANNLQILRDFIDQVDDGAQLLLDKIQGIGHGGGVMFRASTQQFKDMETFLDLLEEEAEDDGSSGVTQENLLQHVALESDSRTLWRAALVLAGRIPTPAEYASLETEDDGLRTAVRSLMKGQEFHDFLIRSSNDRLLTDRDKRVFEEYGLYVDYTNRYYELNKAASETGNRREFESWWQRTHFGVRREGLELIAHVVENDLPYTEILTADYVMANPYSGQSYASETEFIDPTNAFEFRKSDVYSYYRRCAGRALQRTDFGPRITSKGTCPTDLPFAGVLTNKTFLLRYPTTATNRNRARSRWTYYHFLDVDIENSASRTTDPTALADTDNPTMKNSACTVCHSELDPVAGAFQDYGEEGDYWDEPKGYDSLDYNYKVSLTLPRLDVNAATFEDRELVSITEELDAGTTQVQLAVVFDSSGKWSDIAVDYLSLKSDSNEEITRYEIEDLEHLANDRCGSDLVDQESGEAYAYSLKGWVYNRNKCAVVVDVAVPQAGTYTLEASVWVSAQSENVDGEPAQFVIAPERFYRDGDTWYRDMRNPGFTEFASPSDLSSIQWLAQKIAQDDRFAQAAVKFWWPAIMGQKVEDLPTNKDLPNFNDLVVGINAQHNHIEALAQKFRIGINGGEAYNLRDLLTEMVLSPWFRGQAISQDESSSLSAALETVGARRLLTPEELARKTAAVTGFQWGRKRDERRWRWPEDYQTNSLDAQYMYKLLYGGIDSDGIIERARDMTAVMAGVAKTHAVEASCPIIMREMYLLDDQNRYLFGGIDKWTSPDYEFGNTFEVTASAATGSQTVSLLGSLPPGDITLVMSFLNDYYQAANNDDRNIRIDTIRVKDGNGEVVSTYDLEDDAIEFLNAEDCNRLDNGILRFDCEGTAELAISIVTAGTYTIEVELWADQAGDETPQLFVSANSNTVNSIGSRKIKTKLVELHEKLLGVELNVDSTPIQNRYDLLVSSWQRNKAAGATFNSGRACNHWSDYRFLEGIVEEPFVANYNEWNGVEYRRNNEAWNTLNQSVDWSDPRGIATTWVVVLTSYLIDYDYLHL